MILFRGPPSDVAPHNSGAQKRPRTHATDLPAILLEPQDGKIIWNCKACRSMRCQGLGYHISMSLKNHCEDNLSEKIPSVIVTIILTRQNPLSRVYLED